MPTRVCSLCPMLPCYTPGRPVQSHSNTYGDGRAHCSWRRWSHRVSATLEPAACSSCCSPSSRRMCKQHMGTAGVRRLPASSRARQEWVTCAQSSDPAAGDEGLGSSFQKELELRKLEQTRAEEARAAADFSGETLLKVLQDRYGRSYDVSMVQRQLAGKTFVALNIMWKYREQASFTLSEEQYMARLEIVAEQLRAWGVVKNVTEQIASRKERPRVGKAVSIMINLDDDTLSRWFA